MTIDADGNLDTTGTVNATAGNADLDAGEVATIGAAVDATGEVAAGDSECVIALFGFSQNATVLFDLEVNDGEVGGAALALLRRREISRATSTPAKLLQLRRATFLLLASARLRCGLQQC